MYNSRANSLFEALKLLVSILAQNNIRSAETNKSWLFNRPVDCSADSPRFVTGAVNVSFELTPTYIQRSKTFVG